MNDRETGRCWELTTMIKTFINKIVNRQNVFIGDKNIENNSIKRSDSVRTSSGRDDDN